MTIGENIRRIRQQRHMTVKELADRIGVSDTYLRFYENGQRFPKKDAINKLAEALNVNPEALLNAEADPISSMHRLFHIFKQYGGKIYDGAEISSAIKKGTIKDTDIFLSFDGLSILIRSWENAYKAYKKAIVIAENMSDPLQKANAIIEAQNEFDWWMDLYPESDPDQDMVNNFLIMEEAADYMANHPLNDPEHPMTEEEKAKANAGVKKIYSKLKNQKK